MRTRLFSMFDLPAVTVNFGLLEPPDIDQRTQRRLAVLNEQRIGETRQLKEILNEIGISGCSDDTVDDKAEWQVKSIYSKLWRASNYGRVQYPHSRKDFLDFGQFTESPVCDVLLNLGEADTPYNRFLVGVIYNGRYGSESEVLREFDLVKGDDEIEWFFIMYHSGRIDEHQLGVSYLRCCGLQFIDEFLMWEAEVPFGQWVRSSKA